MATSKTSKKTQKKGHQGEDTQALKVAYVTWLLDPVRDPKTQGQWAALHDLNQATVSLWKSDEFVLDLLKKANTLMEPVWARAMATLAVIATDPDHINCVAAIRELGKLLRKYPNEKLDVNVIEKVAYVQPGALAAYSRQIEASEARVN